jgi:hypothetical protein
MNVSLRAPDDRQSMSVDLMSGASVEEIQASLGGWGGEDEGGQRRRREGTTECEV